MSDLLRWWCDRFWRACLTMMVVLAAIFSAGAARATEVSAGSARPVTHVEVETLAGKPFEFSTLRGRPVVVYVWGEWCRACERSTPAMLELARAHPTVNFLFINTDSTGRALRTPTPELPSNLIQTQVSTAVFDSEVRRRKRFEFSQLGLVFGVPAYYLVNAGGMITARGNGSRYPAALSELLAPVLGVSVP